MDIARRINRLHFAWGTLIRRFRSSRFRVFGSGPRLQRDDGFVRAKRRIGAADENGTLENCFSLRVFIMQMVRFHLDRNVFPILVWLYKNCGNRLTALGPGIQCSPISIELQNGSLDDVSTLPETRAP